MLAGAEMQRVQGLEIIQPDEPAAAQKTRRPSGEQAISPEPARIEAENHGRKGLQNPHAAEQLQIERELRWQKQNDQERADLHGERGDLRDFRLARGGDAGIDIGFPEIAGEEIGGADAHDRGRHQGADRDRRESETGEPSRK